ncbi:unnamed protein product [Euphydryas editha]|uniref:Uncharacterized protein n=1 Tax=Euphydryas editha TaxID=104508 RepID=A0AAU9UG10_EUPED|nr:unnamed protein product [Euphydryas editha]
MNSLHNKLFKASTARKLVQKKKYKARTEEDIVEIYVSSNEKMPKQFALAKILQNAGIGEIKKVKYVNPNKIRLEMNNSRDEKIKECKEFIDRGWRIQRAMEVSLCYGVIKDVDIDLKDEDIPMHLLLEIGACHVQMQLIKSCLPQL